MSKQTSELRKTANQNSFALLYPQTVTLYQVDDQIYEPQEVATTNLFNTFLDALDGVSLALHII